MLSSLDEKSLINYVRNEIEQKDRLREQFKFTMPIKPKY